MHTDGKKNVAYTANVRDRGIGIQPIVRHVHEEELQ